MNDTVPDASAEPATVSAAPAPKEESKGSAVWREIKGLGRNLPATAAARAGAAGGDDPRAPRVRAGPVVARGCPLAVPRAGATRRPAAACC